MVAELQAVRPAVPDLRAVRRRAAELIERDGHAVVEECIGRHGPSPRSAENGPRCAVTAIGDAMAEMGFGPSVITADAHMEIARQLCEELGSEWFSYGLTLYHWNDFSTAQEIIAGLRGEVI